MVNIDNNLVHSDYPTALHIEDQIKTHLKVLKSSLLRSMNYIDICVKT